MPLCLPHNKSNQQSPAFFSHIGEKNQSDKKRAGMGSQDEEILSPPIWKSAVMKELARGLDSATKLAYLLQAGSSENGWQEAAKARLLTEEIMGGFSKAMAAVESVENMKINLVEHPSSCVTGNKEGVGGKSTRKAGYRRRGSPYSWKRITSNPIDDGHTWRKYGQKDIFSAKYPRSYFRCTHKYDQDCKASKQVQRSEDDPSMYVITYFGEHTCVGAKKAASITPSSELCIISFESSNGENIKQETLSSFPSLNLESEEEVLSNLTSVDSGSDYFTSPKVDIKKSVKVQTAVELGPEEHNGFPLALYSSFMNYGIEFMDCEDFLNFDHDLFQN